MKYHKFIEVSRHNKKTGVTHKARRGAIAGIIDGTTLKVGWSLCFRGKKIRKPLDLTDPTGKVEKVELVSTKVPGDRFSAEQAISMATGRAINQHPNSLKLSKAQINSMTTVDPMNVGIPQSTIRTMGSLIKEALKDHPTVNKVVIFNEKIVVQSTPSKFLPEDKKSKTASK